MSTEIDPSTESPWYEYLQSDLFWALAIFIGINAGLTYGLHELLAKKDEAQEDTQPSAAPQKPTPGIYLKKYIDLKDLITSRFRQNLIFLLCALPFPFQLLQSVYVFKTIWRISSWLVQACYPSSIRPRLLDIIIFSPIGISMLAVWAWMLMGGAWIIGIQAALCGEVSKLEPNARPDLPLAFEEEV
ncbi:hypothetical protein FPHYL_1945 [Fusarium phyllophilum]|uniref:Uncharacterized protein n=1 Tax=Fusarium phyllophilum TaxID=47803 RepID=A0A8H5NLZ1_9HYPO|nr:hypothetical protein FPHYL_1945 [Fusarium phyllophilum]